MVEAGRVRGACRSHITVVGRRDDCNMVRLRDPGSALVISTEDPAYRFKRSSPCWTTNKEDQRESLRS